MRLFKKRLSELEAAHFFFGVMLEKVGNQWATSAPAFERLFSGAWHFQDESHAKYDLFLASLSLDLQALRNLFPEDQARRLELYVLDFVGRVEEWGSYGTFEVQQYMAAFRREEALEGTAHLNVIPARLLKRWLGEDIGLCEAKINGRAMGHIDVFTMGMISEIVFVQCGVWKRIKDGFRLVEN